MNSHIKTTKKGHISLLIWSIFLFLFSYTFASASTYYVSNTGSDSNNGTSTSTPWQTLAKVNASTFIPGDSILFKKGDTFYGSITVSQSGTSGNPITFSSYGSGNQPIITGFTDVTSWTNLGNNIWESTNTVSTLDTVNMVTVNGTNTAMGRYPNADTANGGYLNIDANPSSTSLANNTLNGTPNWTGAEVAIRSGHYLINRRMITGQSGSIITFNTATVAHVDYGFFIQNDPRTLDQQNEWYYNPTTHKIQIYSMSQPTGVKVASVDNLVNLNAGYITIDSLSFSGANTNVIYRNIHYAVMTNNTIKNSDFSSSGVGAISARFDNFNIENNTIKDSNSFAINIGYSNYVILRNNVIQNTGILQGMGIIDGGTNSAIGAGVVSNVLMEYNTILNTGLNGISFYGHDINIKNNFIDTFCVTLEDGGGIYTYTGDLTDSTRPYMSNVVIDRNIIINGIGNPYGVKNRFPGAGIYLDENSKNIEVSNNSIANVFQFGIFMTSAGNIITRDNTVYNATQFQYYSTNWGIFAPPVNNQVNNNIFISKSGTEPSIYEGQKSLAFYFEGNNQGASILASTTLNNNYYARPIADTKVVFINLSIWNDCFKTLSEWQTFSSQDTNSKKSPVAVSSESDIFFDYNATTSNKTSTLPWPAVDMDGVKHTGNVTILPYSSVIYLKDPNPASSDTTAPTISSFTIPTTSSSLTVPISTFTATDTVGVTGYLLTETSATPSAASGSWSSTVPTSYVFSTEGSKTLYAWAKDAASNVSTSVSDTVVIILPVVTSQSGGGGSSSNTSLTSSVPSTSQSSTLSSKAKAKDIKQDGSINIFDFNIIMANWNKTYSTTTSLSKGDMTGDGIINIFDINQLMIYWGVGY